MISLTESVTVLLKTPPVPTATMRQTTKKHQSHVSSDECGGCCYLQLPMNKITMRSKFEQYQAACNYYYKPTYKNRKIFLRCIGYKNPNDITLTMFEYLLNAQFNL